jgi:hypothetical protein
MARLDRRLRFGRYTGDIGAGAIDRRGILRPGGNRLQSKRDAGDRCGLEHHILLLRRGRPVAGCEPLRRRIPAMFDQNFTRNPAVK